MQSVGSVATIQQNKLHPSSGQMMMDAARPIEC